MKINVPRWFAFFFLAFLTSIPAYSQSQTVEHPASPADAGELRALTRQYFDALVKNDWQAIAQLVSINSIDMLERKDLLKKLLDHSVSVRLVKLTVGKISVQETDNDAIKDLIVKEITASLPVQVSIGATDSRTGKPIAYLAQMNRILTFKKGGESFGEGGIREIGWPLHHARLSQNPLQADQQRLEAAERTTGWKLLSDLPDADSLVQPLKSAISEEEVRVLLSEETQTGLGSAIKNLERRGGDLIRNDQLGKGLDFFHLARKLEKQLLERKGKRNEDTYKNRLEAAYESLTKLQKRDKDALPPLANRWPPGVIPGAPGLTSSTWPPDEASITEGIGDIQVDHGAYGEALKCYLKSLLLFDKSNTSSRWRLAQKIGYVYAKEENYSKAIEFYLASIKYYEEMNVSRPLLGRVDDHKARMLDKIGDAYVLQGAFDKALESYQQCIEELKRLTVSLRTEALRYEDVTSQLVAAIESVAKVYEWQHMDGRLLQHYRESVHELEYLGLNDEALALLLETVSYWTTHNNFEAALEDLQRLHTHYDSLVTKSDEDYLTIAFLDFDMAMIHLLKGENGTSVQLLTSAEALISKTSSDGDFRILKPFVEGWMHQMVGAVIFDQGDEKAGDQMIREGNSNYPADFWQGAQSVSKTLAMFAVFHQDKLDALELYRNALALTDIEGDPTQAVDLLCKIGGIYLSQNKSAEALASYREALRLVPSEPNGSRSGVGPQDFYWKRVYQVPTDAPTMDALKRDMDVKERDRQELRIPRAWILLKIGTLYKESKQYTQALGSVCFKATTIKQLGLSRTRLPPVARPQIRY
jgi:tetratricopeptide (TPR) repeat protein